MSLSKLRERVKDRERWCVASMGLQRVRHNGATEQQWSRIAHHEYVQPPLPVTAGI